MKSFFPSKPSFPEAQTCWCYNSTHREQSGVWCHCLDSEQAILLIGASEWQSQRLCSCW